MPVNEEPPLAVTGVAIQVLRGQPPQNPPHAAPLEPASRHQRATQQPSSPGSRRLGLTRASAALGAAFHRLQRASLQPLPPPR